MGISSPPPPRDDEEAHLSGSTADSCHVSRSRKRGGWRAIKYILGNESFEKLASMSLIANITVYLRTEYNLTGIFLVNIVTIWSGSTNVSSIAGAIVSDAYLGRFLTLLFGTISSLMGMTAMTMTAAVTELRPPPCAEEDVVCTEPHKWQLAFLLTGLGLISIGAGGIRPCNIAFGADQFNTNTEKGRAQMETFFNWWYFSFTVALIIALTVVIYIQTNISWVIGFAIPTACLAISIAIFLVGRHLYVYKRPRGSVFVDMAKVVVAAYRKRKVDLNAGDGVAYYDPLEEEEKLERTERFRYLDRACVVADPAEVDGGGRAVNGWRLCGVHQVEILKCLFGIFPVWVSGVGCFLVMDQQSTFGILQTIQMDRTIGKSFTLPPAWMGISSMIALSIWILLYEKLYVPLAKKATKKDHRLKMEHRILIGIVLAITCMVVAAVVEKKRRTLALTHGEFVSPLHVGALLPQFVLAGLTEALAAVALMEFFTLRLPESLRSVAGAVFFLSLSVASYLSSLVVNIIHSITGTDGHKPWLGGHDLNDNKLDYYYSIIAAVGVIDLLYFCLFARRYVNPASKNAAPVGGEVEMEQGSLLRTGSGGT